MEDICAICLDNTDNSSYKSLCCKNKFHFECLDKWFKIKNTCPLCRKEYSHMSDYHNHIEEYFDTINNINVENIIDNVSENVSLYKYQFEELQYDKLVKILGNVEKVLDVLKGFYDNRLME